MMKNCKYGGRPTFEDEERLAEMTQAGLRGDHSQVPAMIDVLKNPPHIAFPYTVIHALAQLGATEALPVMELYVNQTMEQPPGDTNLSNHALVARARLLAENSARDLANGKAQAAVKVHRFFAELGISSAHINAGLAAEKAKRSGFVISSAPDPVSIERYALRALADMAYQGNNPDFAGLPEVSVLRFQEDYPSVLKMRLAPLSREQRIATLVDELSHRKVGKTEIERYDMQLLINEGTAASHAVAAQLVEMQAHRSSYASAGFAAMFCVLTSIGDQEQVPIIERFLHDSEGWVASYAGRAYRELKYGIKSQLAVSY